MKDFRYDVTGSELREHFAARFAYHTDRSAHYLRKAEEQASKVEEQLLTVSTVTDRIAIKNSTNFRNDENDREKYTNAAASHQRSAKLFQWRFDHIEKAQAYQISEHEIATFELIT